MVLSREKALTLNVGMLVTIKDAVEHVCIADIASRYGNCNRIWIIYRPKRDTLL